MGVEYELRETRPFQKWLKKVDRKVRLTVVVRLARVEKGNLGDHRSVGGGVSELRFHAGKGPRIYYTNQGETIILLLVGGDKSSQDDDLKAAKKIVKDMRR